MDHGCPVLGGALPRRESLPFLGSAVVGRLPSRLVQRAALLPAFKRLLSSTIALPRTFKIARVGVARRGY